MILINSTKTKVNGIGVSVIYAEIVKKFIAAGASREIVLNVFNKKKYCSNHFADYVYDRMLRACPLDVDSWLKVSISHCLNAFKGGKRPPVVTARKKVREKQSIDTRERIRVEKEVESNLLIRKEYDDLSQIERGEYWALAKNNNPDKPDYLIDIDAYIIYCEKRGI